MKQEPIRKIVIGNRYKDSTLAGESLTGYGSSTDHLPAIIDSLEDELMVIDKDFNIIEVNNAFLERCGKQRYEVIGKYCYEISHNLHQPCSSPHDECPIKEVLETGRAVRKAHIHTYDIAGRKKEKYLDIIASPILDNQSNVIAITELSRETTETRIMESEYARVQQHLIALNAITSEVSQSLDLDTVLNSALRKTLEIMQRTKGGILLLDEERKQLSYRVSHGLSSAYTNGMCIMVGEGIAGKVAQTGMPIMVDDISKHPDVIRLDLINMEGIRAFASVPLQSKQEVVGVLNVASHEAKKFSASDVRLLNSVAPQIAIAIENARLHQEVRYKDKIRGELLQDMFSIQEEERKRIARELHDETSQVLASLNANLEAATEMLPASFDGIKVVLKKAQALSINILDSIHKLIYELRPSILDDLGLVAAARWLAEKHLEAKGVAVNFKTIGRKRRLPSRLEATLFRVIQEALSNIAKHACAENTSIILNFKKSAIRVSIRDDGKGFDVNEAISSKDRPRGLGLVGMKERIAIVNGTLDIQSYPDDGGTEIDIEIPINQEVSHG